jgi:hypothetical protein
MEWQSPLPVAENMARPLDRIGFDMLRAIISSRQTMSPTVQALISALAPADLTENLHTVSALQILSGRHAPHADQGMSGSFTAPKNCAQPFAEKGESHA